MAGTRRGRGVVAGVMATLAAAGLVAWWTSSGGTPPFRDEQGRILANSIAEERRIVLGGVGQYVLIRGRDRAAPLMINVHGGPGMSERALYRHHNAMLEDHFVIAYWDQRGAGKSFDRALDPSTLTIDRMARDLGELIDTLRAEFGRDKVIILAHSWGTILGLEHCARHPETVAAYIGIGQVSRVLESEAEGYAWALDAAERQGEAEIAAALRALGPPPWTAGEFLEERNHLYKLNGFYALPPSPLKYIREVLSTPETSWADLVPMFRAMPWTIGHLWPENQAYDAFERHKALEVPVYLMLGRHDHAVSPRLAEAWLAGLAAPRKEAIWFETAGHMVPAEDPAAFHRAVLRIGREAGLLDQ